MDSSKTSQQSPPPQQQITPTKKVDQTPPVSQSPSQNPTAPSTPVPAAAAVGGWNPGDILAVEHVERQSGVWRWAIVSVSQPPVGTPANANPSRRCMWVRAWEPLPRRDLSAAERKEAARLEAECEVLVAACAKQRTALDEAHLSSLQKQREVNHELSIVEEHLRELLPLIESARAKVAAISAAHIREIRGYRKPPTIVQRAVDPVQVLFGETRANLGDWQKASHMMAAVDFVSRVRDLDPVQLPLATAKQFVAYVNKEFPIPGKKNKKKTEGGELSRQLSTTMSEALFVEHDQPADELFPPGSFDAEIEATTRASAAAGRLLEWVLAMREFIVRAPTGAGASLQRVATLRQQQVELNDTIEDLEFQLKDVARRRAALDRAAAIIKFGAAAMLIDQQLSTVSTPLVLLRDDRETLVELTDSLWRPNPEAPAFALPAVTILGRLRSGCQTEMESSPSATADAVEATDGSTAVSFSRFILTPDMASLVVEKGSEALPIGGHTFDIDPPTFMGPPKVATTSPTPPTTVPATSEAVLSPVSVSTNPTLPAQLEAVSSQEVKQIQGASQDRNSQNGSATPVPTEAMDPTTPVVAAQSPAPEQQSALTPVKSGPITPTKENDTNKQAAAGATPEQGIVRSSGSFTRTTSVGSLCPMSLNKGSPNPKGALTPTQSGDWPHPKGNSPSLEARVKRDATRPNTRPTSCW